MGQKFLMRLTAFAVAMAVLVVGAGVAWADNVKNDVETSHPSGVSIVAGDSTSSATVGFFVQGTGGCDISGSESITFPIITPAGVTATPASVTFTGCGATVTTELRASSSASSGNVSLGSPTSNTTGSTDFNRSPATFALTVTQPVGDSVAPGSPLLTIDDGAAWTNSATGAVSLDFSATDNVGVAAYKLAETSAGLAGATATTVDPAEASFTRSDQSFTLTGLEGTKSVWLQVCDASNNCATASDTIGWDKTAPNAPIAGATTSADYDGGTPSDPSDDWWKNTVTVDFASNGDPGGAAASGVNAATLSASETFNTTGTHSTTGGTVDDNAGNRSARGGLTVKVDATAPTVSFDSGECPTTLVKDSTASADWTAQDTGSGLASDATGSLSLPTNVVGARTVYAPQATDNVGLTSSTSTAGTCTYSVVYDWTGFFRPIDNDGVYNKVKAGSAVPVKFSLGGDQGLSIFGTGTNNDTTFSYPTSRVIQCDTNGEVDAVEETVTAGSSSLSYDADANQYTYVWKTEKAWSNSCRQLVVKLNDGTIKRANFKFTK